MSAVRFSIVTPSFNQAATVGETMESVLSQAGDFEIEYTVVDGGSSDGSVEVIRRLAERVGSGTWPVRCAGLQMRWVSEPDHGQADAINKGFRRSAGNIVSWLNSDDRYLPGAFGAVAKAFARHPEADFVYGDGDVIDRDGRLSWEWLARPYDLDLLTTYHFLWNDFTNYILQQATFWRRSVFDEVGYLDEKFHFALDVEFWIRAGRAGLRFVHLPEKLGQFRWAEGTKSLSSPTVFWEDYLEIFRRYRGARQLGPFLAYYYYNEVRSHRAAGEDHAGPPGARVDAAEARLFRRWGSLSPAELDELHRQSRRGRRMAHLLLANDWLAAGNAEAARRHFEAAVGERPRLALHPLALWYLTQSAVGPRVAAWLAACGQLAIGAYRRHRYDYRYQS